MHGWETHTLSGASLVKGESVGAASGPGTGFCLTPANGLGALPVSHASGLAFSPSQSRNFFLGDSEVPSVQVRVT